MTEALINRLRLGSGLVMFGYVASHLANVALGLVSLHAMNLALFAVVLFWGNAPMTALLAASLVVHAGFALRALYRRRSLRMPAAEACQLALGLAIPFFLALHLAKTRLAESALGARIDFTTELLQFWIADPVAGLQQVVLLIVAWNHACIGINFNLRYRRWYGKAAPWLLLAAVLVPLLALLGFAEAGREVMALARHPGWIDRIKSASGIGPAEAAMLAEAASALRILFFGPLAAILVARWARQALARRRSITLLYPSGRRIRIPRGMSVLEASRLAAIPHASVCGGRGRCSTCRTWIAGAAGTLPEPGAAEAAVLARLKLPPGVRLACQLRPHGDIEVTPLVPGTGFGDSTLARQSETGMEREVVILFCDLRGFTRLAEERLPFDVVFLLNRYFATMGQAIEEAGGRIDKFIGDGIMALFGAEGGEGNACRQALAAAAAMSRRLDGLNHGLRHDLPQPLRIGIGLHVGPAVVGEMGWGRAVSLTAVGDAVNTASRLEALTKEFEVELIVSEDVGRGAGLPLDAWPEHEIALRGRSGALRIRAIPRGQDLSGLL